MGEISAASNEQSAGVAQVGEAVRHMDNATQQNAALVEEMAAAASSLKGQAQDLVQLVSVFRLSTDREVGTREPYRPAQRVTSSANMAHSKSSPFTLGTQISPQKLSARKATAKALSTPAKALPKTTAASSENDWETF
jgi:hypothetical protein